MKFLKNVKTDEFMATVTRTASKYGYKLKKASPTIMIFGAAIVGVAATVSACKATVKAQDILEDHNEMVKAIHAQIDDMRDHYRKKEADLDTMIEEKAQQKSMEQLTGKYRTESDPEDIATHDPIEIIQPDEFGDIDDYETRGLTYYADGKLVFDEETMPVNDDDIPNIIGTEALNHFGEFMPSTIHVRNNNYHKDYEIIQVRQNWGDLYPEEEEE